MKQPVDIKELLLPDNTPGDFSYEGFLTYNKYRLHPTASFRYAGASRIKNILNATENRCIVVIERSTGTSVALMDGDAARELTDKCIDKTFAPKFIVPGKSFGFSNSKAIAGEPLEIKFHYYNAYEPSDESSEEQNKILNQAIYELHSAFKSFYAFERVKITTSLIEALFRDETVFFKLDINDEKTYVEGVFLLKEQP